MHEVNEEGAYRLIISVIKSSSDHFVEGSKGEDEEEEERQESLHVLKTSEHEDDLTTD